MATNLAIDEKLLKEALKLGKFKTKRETVNEVLREFVKHKKRRVRFKPSCKVPKSKKKKRNTNT